MISIQTEMMRIIEQLKTCIFLFASYCSFTHTTKRNKFKSDVSIKIVNPSTWNSQVCYFCKFTLLIR